MKLNELEGNSTNPKWNLNESEQFTISQQNPNKSYQSFNTSAVLMGLANLNVPKKSF